MKKNILLLYNAFIKIYGFRHVIFNHFFSYLTKHPIISNTDLTLDKIITSKCSVSRYGDGEFSLISGKSLFFQPFYPVLQQKLQEILISERNNHIVCIPYAIIDTKDFVDSAKSYWKRYLSINRHKIYKKLDLNKNYFDSLVTRLYVDYSDKNKAAERFTKFKFLWHEKNVLIVEGDKSRLGVGNDLFSNAKAIGRIICPSIDAFAKYDVIVKSIEDHQSNYDLILLALGPTATVIAYDLYDLNCPVVDIGHIDIEYEWFCNKADFKVPVKNKFIGEIPGGTDVNESCDDIDYKKSLLTTIN